MPQNSYLRPPRDPLRPVFFAAPERLLPPLFCAPRAGEDLRAAARVPPRDAELFLGVPLLDPAE